MTLHLQIRFEIEIMGTIGLNNLRRRFNISFNNTRNNNNINNGRKVTQPNSGGGRPFFLRITGNTTTGMKFNCFLRNSNHLCPHKRPLTLWEVLRNRNIRRHNGRTSMIYHDPVRPQDQAFSTTGSITHTRRSHGLSTLLRRLHGFDNGHFRCIKIGTMNRVTRRHFTARLRWSSLVEIGRERLT